VRVRLTLLDSPGTKEGEREREGDEEGGESTLQVKELRASPPRFGRARLCEKREREIQPTLLFSSFSSLEA